MCKLVFGFYSSSYICSYVLICTWILCTSGIWHLFLASHLPRQICVFMFSSQCFFLIVGGWVIPNTWLILPSLPWKSLVSSCCHSQLPFSRLLFVLLMVSSAYCQNINYYQIKLLTSTLERILGCDFCRDTIMKLLAF